MTRAIALAAVVAIAACGDAPQLDAAHLPAELHGLVPGVSTEVDAIGALPGATATRDRSFGGDKIVEVNDRPAINLRSADEKTQVWLATVDGKPRVVWITTPHEADCAAIAKTFGDRAKAGTCHYSNRVPERSEHQLCADGAGGRKIEITCHDRGSLELFYEFVQSNGIGYRIAPIES